MPIHLRMLLYAFLVIIVCFNIWIAPQQLATSGWFGLPTQPQEGLFALDLANICAAIAMIVRAKKQPIVAVFVTIILLALSAYAWYGGVTFGYAQP